MLKSDNPTASYSTFEEFLQSGTCSNKHEAEAIWAFWRPGRSHPKYFLQDFRLDQKAEDIDVAPEREGAMLQSHNPNASHLTFEEFLQSGVCRNEHEAEAIWEFWQSEDDRRLEIVEELAAERMAAENVATKVAAEQVAAKVAAEKVAARMAAEKAAEKVVLRRLVWILLIVVAIVPVLWSQWYFSGAQVFRRASDDLGGHIGRGTNDLYLHYFKALGAKSGYSKHHVLCFKTNCTFSYTHSYSIPIKGTNDQTHLSLSAEITLWPFMSGVDQQLAFLGSTEWWPRGSDINWKIGSVRMDEQFRFTNWQTHYSGTQNEVHKSPETLRPLVARTISAIELALRETQAK